MRFPYLLTVFMRKCVLLDKIGLRTYWCLDSQCVVHVTILHTKLFFVFCAMHAWCTSPVSTCFQSLMYQHCGALVFVGVGFLVALPITSAGRVKYMLWAEAAFSVAIVGLCAFDHVAFAALPPLPPSASAVATPTRRVSIFKDMLTLFRSPVFLVITLSYGLSLGTYSGWSSVIDPILSPLGVSQTTASWLGFSTTMASVVGGIVFGRLGDRLKSVKIVLIALFIVSSAVFAWFTLLANHVLHPSTWQMFLSITLGRYCCKHSEVMCKLYSVFALAKRPALPRASHSGEITLMGLRAFVACVPRTR